MSGFPSSSQFVAQPSTIASSSFSPIRETQEEAKRRFEIECEFVQALANPHYLNCKIYGDRVV